MSSPASVAPRTARAVAVALLLVFVGVAVQNAWVCDDAFITWRTIDHFLAGRGLVYNAGERVQAFTHPLWLALLAVSHTATREAWWTTVFLGVACSTGAVYMLAFRLAPPGWIAPLLILAASSSRAFVEYSTSGLENPLSHLILAALACVYFRRAPGTRTVGLVALGAASASLCRPDLALVGMVLLGAAVVQARGRGGRPRELLGASLLGLMPWIAWELFSLVYYGSLVPNTALAKLGVGIPRVELVAQGTRYLRVAFETDPLTPFVIVAALVLVGWRRDRQAYALRWAIGLHLAYVIWIGGDFMAGRFLTVPFVLALACLARVGRPNLRDLVAPTLAILVLAALGDRAPITTTASDHWRPGEPRDRLGVADERSFYAESSSLLAWRQSRSLPDHRWRRLGEEGPEDGADVVVFSTPGFYGYYARPDLHIIDGFALADPLLARLPCVRRVNQKPGHYSRHLPEGYVRSRRQDENHIADPVVAELYDALRRVHGGPLWRRDRWVDIWRLNTGYYTRDLDFERYRFAEAIRVRASSLRSPREAIEFRGSGVFIELEGPLGPAELTIELDGDEEFALHFRREGKTIATTRIASLDSADVVARRLTVPSVAARGGCDELHLMPSTLRGKRRARLLRLTIAGD